MFHLGQITVTPNGHMLKPLSYPYRLLDGFLICPLDRFIESINGSSMRILVELLHLHGYIHISSSIIDIFYSGMLLCVIVFLYIILLWLCVLIDYVLRTPASV